MRFLLDDERMERAMGVLLRFGVVLASTAVLAGLLFYLQDHGGKPVQFHDFKAYNFDLRHGSGLFSGSPRGNAAAIIELGIILLIATPVARVVFAVVAFAMERDRLYTAISLAVLAVLVYSLLHAS
ncbi:MAG: DUF1634 domain-containing protein [Acidobacteria bacterium]|nr:DUF1634 domain-containing protein [Acidobacteriota bacterium]